MLDVWTHHSFTDRAKLERRNLDIRTSALWAHQPLCWKRVLHAHQVLKTSGFIRGSIQNDVALVITSHLWHLNPFFFHKRVLAVLVPVLESLSWTLWSVEILRDEFPQHVWAIAGPCMQVDVRSTGVRSSGASAEGWKKQIDNLIAILQFQFADPFPGKKPSSFQTPRYPEILVGPTVYHQQYITHYYSSPMIGCQVDVAHFVQYASKAGAATGSAIANTPRFFQWKQPYARFRAWGWKKVDKLMRKDLDNGTTSDPPENRRDWWLMIASFELHLMTLQISDDLSTL